MQTLLASSNPLDYSGKQLQKTKQSLQALAKLIEIPLTLEHDGPIVGAVKNIKYQLIRGVGYLFGDVPDTMGKLGVSLQYKAKDRSGKLSITEVDHVALTNNPRDTQSIFSDSVDNPVTYRDSIDGESEDKSTEPPKEETKTTDQTDSTTQEVELELTDELMGKISEQLLSSKSFLEKLEEMGYKKEEPKTTTDQTQEPPETKKSTQTVRVFSKPVNPVATQSSPQPRKIQQAFRSI